MKKKKIILPSKRHFGSIDQDLDLRIGLEESRNLLRENDRNIKLDTSVLFNKERNESNNYKIHGKLRMVFKNLYAGTTDYQPLSEKLYLLGNGFDENPTWVGNLPYNEFAFLRNDTYRQYNDEVTTGDLTQFTSDIKTTEQSSHIPITTIDAPYHNWNLYLSYVYTGDTQHPMTYTTSGSTAYEFVAGDGIPFNVVENETTYTLTSLVDHGISVGEYITISGGTLDNSVSPSGRTFSIVSVGDVKYNSEKYVLDIPKSEVVSGTILGDVVLGKRCTNRNKLEETTSIYYVHKHKTITDESDYILDKVGFESSIFTNEKKIVAETDGPKKNVLVEKNRMENMIYDFKKPVVLNELTNNFGYTPTEVYVTTVFRNGNGYFDYPFKTGYKFNFHDTWIDTHFSGSTAEESTVPYGSFSKTSKSINYNFISGGTLPLDTELTGNFIEYNHNELKERIISECFHKITSPVGLFDHEQDNDSFYSGSSANNKFGLHYQSHYRVKLRELSPYVETSKSREVYGLPQNAKYFEDKGIWKWRDVYDHGFIDPEGFGTNFPFTNDTHYVKNDINFYLRNEKDYTNKQDGIKAVKKLKC